MGFLVMDEIFDEWCLSKNKIDNYYSQNLSYGSGMFFPDDARKELVSMLRRDFNHPSVVLWSIGIIGAVNASYFTFKKLF